MYHFNVFLYSDKNIVHDSYKTWLLIRAHFLALNLSLYQKSSFLSLVMKYTIVWLSKVKSNITINL